jgi:hypothetical protein
MNKEDNMTIYLLIGFGLLVSGFAISKKNTVIGILASAIWLAAISYSRAHPIGEMVIGDTADTAILLVFISLMVLVPIISFNLSKKEEATGLKDEGLLKDDEGGKLKKLRDSSSTKTRKESADEYYDKLHSLTHPQK